MGHVFEKSGQEKTLLNRHGLELEVRGNMVLLKCKTHDRNIVAFLRNGLVICPYSCLFEKEINLTYTAKEEDLIRKP